LHIIFIDFIVAINALLVGFVKVSFIQQKDKKMAKKRRLAVFKKVTFAQKLWQIEFN
jgi:hypothetical protein